MSEVKYQIDDESQLNGKMSEAYHMAKRGLAGGPVEVTLGRPGKKRSTQANRLLWKLLTDIAGQTEWAGEKLSPEDWKDLITCTMRKQKVVPGLDGGLVALGSSTSKMTKAEFGDLLDCVYSVGNERGVKWSADTNVDWSEYKEASNAKA